MASTVYLNMLENPRVIVGTDVNPWGGFSFLETLKEVRVQDIRINSGAEFDSVNLVFSDNLFGDQIPFFQPIKIQVYENINTRNATVTTLFRGFTQTNSNDISPQNDVHSVTCYGYKWLLTKRTILRGRWYSTGSLLSTSLPLTFGTGLSQGDAKFDFEKFRGQLQDEAGYAQHQEMVFNKGGFPDCVIDNQLLDPKCVFYVDSILHDETLGAIPDNKHFLKKDWKGYQWTFLTILRHIEEYWIEPYNSSLAPINFNKSDLRKVQNIDKNLRSPMDFSLEGMNILTAIDTVIKSIPGRWTWFLDYSQNNVEIRIKELKEEDPGVVFAQLGGDDKLIENSTNIIRASITRDGSDGVKNVVAKGGKIKLVTTVKLVPLWQRFGDPPSRDFEDEDQYDKWKEFLKDFSGAEEKKRDAVLKKFSREDLEHFLRVYRYYGIPQDGATLRDQIISEGVTKDKIELDPPISREYAAFEIDIRKFFFKNAVFNREVGPPEFGRYSEDVVVFLFDEKHDGDAKEIDSTVIDRAERSSDGIATTTEEKNRQILRKQWIIPERDKINYKFDEKNGTILFELPQFKRNSVLDGNNITEIVQAASKMTFDGSVLVGLNSDAPETRDVYLTATFSTDMQAILSRKTTTGIIDQFNGADFSDYINQDNADFIIHKNAWYPITDENRDIQNPTFITTRTMDQHQLGDVIRKGDDFDNYKSLIGVGAQELFRSLIVYLRGFDRFKETVNLTFPFLETGYLIGDKITNIRNSKFLDLNSYLLNITYSLVGDSDTYSTSLQFKNFYETDKSNVSYNAPRNEAREMQFDQRTQYALLNQIEVDLIEN